MANQIIAPENLDGWNKLGKDCLPGLIGIEVLAVEPDELRARMKVTNQICAPNGFCMPLLLLLLPIQPVDTQRLTTFPGEQKDSQPLN